MVAGLTKSYFAEYLRRGEVIRELEERIAALAAENFQLREREFQHTERSNAQAREIRRLKAELEARDAQAPEVEDSNPLDSSALLPGEDISAWRRRQLGL